MVAVPPDSGPVAKPGRGSPAPGRWRPDAAGRRRWSGGDSTVGPQFQRHGCRAGGSGTAPPQPDRRHRPRAANSLVQHSGLPGGHQGRADTTHSRHHRHHPRTGAPSVAAGGRPAAAGPGGSRRANAGTVANQHGGTAAVRRRGSASPRRGQGSIPEHRNGAAPASTRLGLHPHGAGSRKPAGKRHHPYTGGRQRDGFSPRRRQRHRGGRG